MPDDKGVDRRIKLAALWTSVMFCYLYADFFGLFWPGQLATMNKGIIPPFGQATDGVLVFVSAMMAIPSLMIALSVLLPRRVARPINIAAGLLYSAIISVTMWTSAHFIFFGVIEIALTLTVVVLAWRWPAAAPFSESA